MKNHIFFIITAVLAGAIALAGCKDDLPQEEQKVEITTITVGIGDDDDEGGAKVSLTGTNRNVLNWTAGDRLYIARVLTASQFDPAFGLSAFETATTGGKTATFTMVAGQKPLVSGDTYVAFHVGNFDAARTRIENIVGGMPLLHDPVNTVRQMAANDFKEADAELAFSSEPLTVSATNTGFALRHHMAIIEFEIWTDDAAIIALNRQIRLVDISGGAPFATRLTVNASGAVTYDVGTSSRGATLNNGNATTFYPLNATRQKVRLPIMMNPAATPSGNFTIELQFTAGSPITFTRPARVLQPGMIYQMPMQVGGGKTVSVNPTTDVMRAGETGINSLVAYTVSTTGIAAATYTPTVNNLPQGVTVMAGANVIINASGNSAHGGHLALVGSATTQAGTYTNLTLTIDGTTSAPFTLVIAPAALTGTVTINNTAPRVGDALTATYAPGNGSGAATWSWLRGTTVISGANAANYTVVAADAGATLTARASYANQSGTVQSPATAAVLGLPDGSAGNPFLVANAADLRKVGTGTDGWGLHRHYRQTANINLAGTGNWTPIGCTGTLIPNPFTGTYDGGGFTISSLTIVATSNGPQGMFSEIGAIGVVRNVGLRLVNISRTGAAGLAWAGGIAGRNEGLIQNSYVDGIISGEQNIGGIAGVNSGGEIRNCYSTVSIQGVGTEIIILYLGGITGSNANNGLIINCFATGTIGGNSFIGGIAGRNLSGSTIERCVAVNSELWVVGNAGRVTGNNATGCILDRNFASDAVLIYRNNVQIAINPTGLTTINGASTHIDNINSGTWWSGSSGPGFSTANWSFANGRLPHLRTTTGGTFSQQGH